MVLELTEEQIKLLISKRYDFLKEEKSKDFRELTTEEEENAFASFVVIKLPNGKVAGTTRPYEKSENKKIGLPGGKVEKSESPIDAVKRESEEEGWKVSKIGKIIASKMVSGKSIVYFEGFEAEKLKDYKEKKNGIQPIEVSVNEISNTGYGNDFIEKYYNKQTEFTEQESGQPSSTPTSGASSTQTGAQGYPEVGKWESGVTRGPANQIGNTKWSDIVGSTLKRGKGNPLK
jgi:hypothetical protein